MIEFSATTPFRLAGRLAAAGRDTPSIYLLMCNTALINAVQADLAAEVEIQLGSRLRSVSASEMRPGDLGAALNGGDVWPVFLITLDRWLPTLVESLDRNVVLLTEHGTVLILSSHEIAQRTLAAAPNLRNRITDILAIGSGADQ